jgi:saccharopine dehydrogenase (NAD+, L-lysine forming)
MKKIGIIREGRIPTDRRAPLSPKQCKALEATFSGAKIYVQPSPHRCFKDEEYASLGIPLLEDLSDCEVLLGIKEVPIPMLIPNKLYFFFSHTIKQQPYNRKLLQTILKQNICLIDYETLTNPNGERLVAFGRYAGLVGTYNGLWTFGKRYGLYDLKRAYECFDKVELFKELEKVKLPAIKIALTGGGRVTNGAMELLGKIGIKKVSVQEYLQTPHFQEPVYTQLRSSDYHLHLQGLPFVADDFYQHPQNYKSDFWKFAKATDLLIACAYWNSKAPKLFTDKEMRDVHFNIKVIADLTCDINGSIPCTQRATTIIEPVYDFNPTLGKIEAAFSRESNISIMAIDNLPTEMPRDASESFGEMMLQKVFPSLFGTDGQEIISRAMITQNGNLTEKFNYLQDFVKEEVGELVLER